MYRSNCGGSDTFYHDNKSCNIYGIRVIIGLVLVNTCCGLNTKNGMFGPRNDNLPVIMVMRESLHSVELRLYHAYSLFLYTT